MTTVEFMTERFVRVDDRLTAEGRNHLHPKAHLYPREILTLGLLLALKGVGHRPFYRWRERDYRPLFPQLPTRTRRFRGLNADQALTTTFMAEPSLLGVIDSYGIERIHPRREGRSDPQIGRQGLSNQRWIVGGKLCMVLNNLGWVVDWEGDTANVYEGRAFQELVDRVDGQMVVFADEGFGKVDGHPATLKVCPRGAWKVRRLIETVWSMRTYVGPFNKVMHRVGSYFTMRLGFTMALFNILVQWHGLEPHENGLVHLSIAEFSL